MSYNSEPIHIAFCVNDSYVPYITVTIKSIMENHRNCEIGIHLLIDRISASNKKRLENTVCSRYNVKLNIHLVNDESLRGLNTGVWTIYTWYRILLPQILPSNIKKVLYIDADTVVATDLRELFSLDMINKSIAASVDVQSFDDRAFERCGYDRSKQYVCAGILLMNLEYWRNNGLADILIDWANRNGERIAFPDQDAINYVCRDSKIVLPLRFGILSSFFNDDIFYERHYSTQLRDCIERPAIIHYAGCYPWIKFFATHPMQDYWEKYNNMLEQPVRQVYIQRKWLFFKILIWRLLHHPFKRQARLTIEDIKRRLAEYDS